MQLSIHHSIRSLFITAFLLLAGISDVSAQKPAFVIDGKGRVDNAVPHVGKKHIFRGTFEPGFPDTADFSKANEDARAAHRVKLIKHIEVTLKKFDSVEYFRLGYNEIWTTASVDKFRADLVLIDSQLKKSVYNQQLTRSSNLWILDSVLAQIFNGEPGISVDTTASSEELYRATVKQVLYSNLFLTSYYNATIAANGNAEIKELDSARFYTDAEKLKKLYEPFTKLNVLIKDTMDAMDLLALYEMDAQFDTTFDKTYQYALLKKPIVQQWMWFNEGKPLFNPMDVIAKRTSIAAQSTKGATLYNAYVDSLISRQINRDTVPRFEQFDDLVRRIKTGDSIYGKTGAKTVPDAADIEKLSTTSEVVNEIRIPRYVKDDRFSGVYVHQFSSDNELVVKSYEPIPTDHKYVIAVHNTPKGVKSVLHKADHDTIADVSPFQEEMDSIATRVGSAVSIALPGLEAITGVISKFPKSVTNYAADISTYTLPNIGSNTQKAMSYITPNSTYSVRNYFWVAFASLVLPDYDYPFLNKNEKDAMLNATKTKFSPLVESASDVTNEQIFKDAAKHYDSLFKELLRTTVQPRLVKETRKDSTMLKMVLNASQITSLEVPELEPREETTSRYYSTIHRTEMPELAGSLHYQVLQVAKDTVTIHEFKYKTGRRHRVTVGAGLAFSNAVINEKTDAGGTITINKKEEPVHFMVSVHLYPFQKGLFLQDRRFIDTKKWLSRFNVMGGIAIPAPLKNLYLGAGYNFGPGLVVTGGYHFYQYTSYAVKNDQIEHESVSFERTPFVAVSIDPATIVKLFNIFNN
jgi:hypothetical protein